MFRKMRRWKQSLPEEQCIAILKKGTSGVLAVHGDDDYPYAVPLSYVYTKEKLYFHSAVSGHKLDAIRQNDKVSFCVTDQDTIVPEEYTTYFRSVIVFGRAHVLEGEEKRRAIELLAEKYSPDDPEGRCQEIDREYARLCMIELKIEHMTGKEAIELVRAKAD